MGIRKAADDASVEGAAAETVVEADKADAVEEVETVEETTENDEAGTEEVGADNVDETPDADEEISKKIDSLKDAVQASLEKTRSETSEAVAALEKKLVENAETFMSKVSDLESKFSEFGEELKTTKAVQAELQKSLDDLNSEGSFKKSGDVVTTTPEEKVQKTNAWNGAFSTTSLFK